MGTVLKGGSGAADAPLYHRSGDIARLRVGEHTFGASYATGGEALDLSSYLTEVFAVFFGSVDDDTLGLVQFEYVGGKIVAYVEDATDGDYAEVAAEVDLSGITVPFLAIGR